MFYSSKEKEIIKKFLPGTLISFFRKIVYPERLHLIEKNLNSLFCLYYQKMAAPELNQKTALKNAEFKIYSKVGEDGLILYIFSKVGATNHTFVELGVEEGRECNTANLSLNFGWQGMIVDAGKEDIEKAKAYYAGRSCKVKPVYCFITADNINGLLSGNGFRGEIDLFSIDIDGNDYWVWKQLNAINPRVVVAEYNASLGLRPITMKYNPDFRYQSNLYFGASLAALTKLADSKGYILIGCDSQGHDAFFVRKDVAQGKFIGLTPEKAFYPNPHLIQKIGSLEEQFNKIKHLEFDHV